MLKLIIRADLIFMKIIHEENALDVIEVDEAFYYCLRFLNQILLYPVESGCDLETWACRM